MWGLKRLRAPRQMAIPSALRLSLRFPLRQRCYRRLPFDVARDFSYICGLWQLPNLLITRLDFPANSVPELISQARANSGRYTFASSGAGTTLHLSGELFKQMAGVDILHIPYRGGAPAQIDLLAGRVDMMFGNIPEAGACLP